MRPALPLCLLLSGAASLIFEVLWMRALVLVTGGTRTAVTIALAAFMGGLALGSALAGRRLDRATRPLRVYALLELAIAATAMAVPAVLSALADSAMPARAGLAFVTLAIPAALMGATFPAAVRAGSVDPALARRTVAILYAVNTLGGVAGCLAAGFVLIPELGMRDAGRAAALLNVAAAALAFAIDRRVAPREPSPAPQRPAAAALWAAAGVGFLALAHEVVWTRVLSLVLGTTVYAFALMLAAFLAGIALGARVVAARIERFARPASGVGWAQWAIALATFVWIATLSVPFAVMVHLRESLHDSFVAFSVARFALAALVLAAVSVPMGLTFPLLVAWAHRRAPELARDSGAAYGANTVGAVAGALAAGLWLLPALGIQSALLALAAAGGLAGLAALRGRARFIAAAALVLAAVPALPRLDPRLLNSGVYRYSEQIRDVGLDETLRRHELVFYEEGLNATVAVTRLEGRLQLHTNGKIDGGPIDDRIQLLLGHLPVMLHDDPKRVLVIGLGVGGSIAAVARHPVERIDCVEIEPAVGRAAACFADFYGRPLDDPRVRLIFEDGRYYAARSTEAYDVIVSQPSNPWHTGVSNLFTLEFFRLLRARAAPGGVVCVWLPFYEMDLDDARGVIAAAREAFGALTVWEADAVNVLLISRADVPLLRLGSNDDLARIGIADRDALLERALLDDAGVAALVRGAPPNTDDRPRLEFAVPRRPRDVVPVYRSLMEFNSARPPLSIPLAGETASLLRDVGLGPVSGAAVTLERSFHWAGETAEQHTAVVVRADALELRAIRRRDKAPVDLFDVMARLGVPSPRSWTLRDHPALWSPQRAAEGWYGVFTWSCPHAGRLYSGFLGPGDEPTAADLDRLGLRCLHPGE